MGEVADTAQVLVDGQVLADFTSAGGKAATYIKNQSILLPLTVGGAGQETVIEVRIQDLDGSLFGLRSKEVVIGFYKDLYGKPVSDFLMRTGPSILSAFTLLLLAIGLGVGWRLTRDRRLVPLSFYSVVTAVYHLSFAEVGRQVFLPALAAGPVHFSLRLMQDYFLLLSLIFYFEKNSKWAWLGAFLYGSAVGSLWVLWGLGFHELKTYLHAVYVMAPLVAAPMFIGAYLFWMSSFAFERSWILPAFLVLVVLQLNDLFVFWQLYRGVFFIRWYPAFVVMILTLGLVRRAWNLVQELEREASVGLLAARLSHDIRSPLGALRVVSRSLDAQNFEAAELMRAAVTRLEAIAADVLGNYRASRTGMSDIQLCDWAHAVFQQTLYAKRAPTEPRNVNFEFFGPSVTMRMSPSARVEMDRVIHNLVGNAFESAGKDPSSDGLIRMIVSVGRRGWITLQLVNSGDPIDRFLAERLNNGEKGLTAGKDNGTGLGFWSVRETVRRWGGRIDISPDRSLPGTRVTLTMPASLGA